MSESPDRAPSRGASPRQQRREELRVFGVNACRAVFAHRPTAIRKAYITEARVAQFRDVLGQLASARVGYRVVDNADLDKLTQSQHHEGVCFEVQRAPVAALAEYLKYDRARDAASLLILLDGVGNPHNFGAVLRIAAHFGADALLLPPGSTLSLSGAACRVAEGGAEVVPLVATGEIGTALEQLRQARYQFAATVVQGGRALYEQALPKRLVLMFGAETEGMSRRLLDAVPLKLMIPGTGSVESLNIASAVAVLAAEFWRQHRR